jgi:hypothetical protein
VKEYELYIPLDYNDGSPIEPDKLVRVRDRLLQQFGYLTYLPAENVGYWTLGAVTYRDRIVLYRVVSGDVRRARRFFRRLKEELKHDLKQEEIFIVEKDANVL